MDTPTTSDVTSVPTGAPNANTTPPEIEQTLTLLSGHRSVLGYMVLLRGETLSIIKHSGVVFEGDQGKKYAGVIERIVDSVQAGLEEISGEQNEGDEIKFLRVRTKRHELMVSPTDRYLLAVLHDPTS